MMQVLRMVLAVAVLGCSAGSMALQDGKVNEEVISMGSFNTYCFSCPYVCSLYDEK